MDIEKLTSKDCKELNEAISRAAPKIRFWYTLQNSWKFSIKEDLIFEQTGATSDYDKFYKKGNLSKEEENLKKIHLIKPNGQKIS